MNPLKPAVAVLLIVLLSTAAGYTESGRKRISHSTDSEYTNLNDLEAEILFGRDLAARIVGNYPLVKDEPLLRYVTKVGKGVALFSGRPELTYHFGVLDTDDINAFATPGGYIFITRGALVAMDNEAELAGVLAHEIAHVTERHVVKKLNIKGEDMSGFSAITGVIDANTAAFRNMLEQALDEASQTLFEKGYLIADEMEADSTGIMMAAVAGYDPLALGRFLIRSKGFEKKDATYKGEHPQLTVRINAMNATLKTNGLTNTGNPQVRRRFHEHVNK